MQDHHAARYRASRFRFRDLLAEWRAGRITHQSEDQRRDGDNTAPAQASKDQRRARLRRYVRLFWKERWAMVLILVLGGLAAGTDALWPVLTGVTIDVVAPSSGRQSPNLVRDLTPASALWLLMVTSLAVILVSRILVFVRDRLGERLNQRMWAELRRRLFAHLVRLPLSELQKMKTGGITARLSGDVNATGTLAQQAVIEPVTAGIRLLVVLIILLVMDWRVTLMAFGLLAVMGVVYHRIMIAMRPLHRRVRAEHSEIDGRLVEVFGGIRVVRSFARETTEELAYAVGHHGLARTNLWISLRNSLLINLWNLLMPLTMLAIITIGGLYVLKGQLRIGEVVTMQMLSMHVLGPILQIIRTISETQRNLASLDRIADILEKPREMPDRPAAMFAPTAFREIRFQEVAFAYAVDKAAQGEWTVSGLNLVLPVGQTLALVGASGSGKTTIANLLARLYDPQQGAITLDGHDLRDLRLQSYRSLLGMVHQEVFLFDGTVYENIAYGRRDADRTAVEAAARAANAWEFIERLDKRMDAVIGERGVKLSGGERQRLAIARALLADPRILILDEATSNLDTAREQLIQEATERLRRGRTTLVIAHRLATVQSADRIVVMERGKVVEQGRHEELIARGAGHPYFEMVQRQTLLAAD